MAENRIGYRCLVTVLVKKELQFRWVHVLHLGLLQGEICSCPVHLSIGSSPDVVWVVFCGRLSIFCKISNNCSVVGVIFALTSSF